MAMVQEEIEIGINDENIFIHPYSLSLETISNCLNVLCQEKALIKTRS